MALEKGTVLVAKNNIRCTEPEYQFVTGTEFVYVGSIKMPFEVYIVEVAMDLEGKVYKSHLPKDSGERGYGILVMPEDVEVKK